MRNLLAVMILAALMVCSAVFVGGCSSSGMTARAYDQPTTAPSDSDKDNQNQRDNGSEWYGGEGIDVWH